jgi:hypothetical protein
LIGADTMSAFRNNSIHFSRGPVAKNLSSVASSVRNKLFKTPFRYRLYRHCFDRSIARCSVRISVSRRIFEPDIAPSCIISPQSSATRERGPSELVGPAAEPLLCRYQAPVLHFAKRNHQKLHAMTTLFLSVSLAAAGDSEEDSRGLAECVERINRRDRLATWRGRALAGAFSFTEYDFLKRWAMKYIGNPIRT